MKKQLLVATLVAVAACGALMAADEKPAGTIEFLNSGNAGSTNLPFSEAVRAGDTLYLSGQIGLVPGSARLVPGGLQRGLHDLLPGGPLPGPQRTRHRRPGARRPGRG